MKNPDDHTGEVTNNILAGYVYYHILYKDNPELADKYSWFFNGDKKATETKMNGILNDPQYNWQWNTILPDGKNLGGFSKHIGLILLYNMVEKMGFDAWAEVYQADRAQYYNSAKPENPQNLYDLVSQAAAKQGYDYTAIMDEMGWLTTSHSAENAQAARDAQTQAVNFLWYLMPNSSYDEVYEVVQKLAADDPNLVFQSNYMLVTPDQMEKLGLYGSTTLEFNDLPNDWVGKAVTLMNGDQVQGQFTIGPDGKAQIVGVPVGTYTLVLPDNNHTVDNYYVTVKYNDPEFTNTTNVKNDGSSSSSSSSSSASSSSSSSSVASSSSKVSSSSSSKSSSSSVKSSSSSSSSSSAASSSSKVSSSSSSKSNSSSVKSSSSSSSSSSAASSSSKVSSSSSSKSSSSSIMSSSSEIATSSSAPVVSSSSEVATSSSAPVASSSSEVAASSSAPIVSSSSEVAASSSAPIVSSSSEVVASSSAPVVSSSSEVAASSSAPVVSSSSEVVASSSAPVVSSSSEVATSNSAPIASSSTTNGTPTGPSNDTASSSSSKAGMNGNGVGGTQPSNSSNSSTMAGAPNEDAANMDQNTTAQKSTKSEQNLPQTGENTSIIATIAGVLMLVATSFIGIFKRKK